nr:MAG TPA: hypothetical protein [Caudoviricetes sp.]
MTTIYFADCVIGNVFKTKTSPALPSTYYIGLSTTTPTSDGTGVSEPSDPAYTRVALTSLTAPVGGVIRNDQVISFPDSTEDWGTITHFVLYDAQTGGNLLIYNTVDKPRLIQADSQITFKANGLSLALKDLA